MALHIWETLWSKSIYSAFKLYISLKKSFQFMTFALTQYDELNALLQPYKKKKTFNIFMATNSSCCNLYETHNISFI